MNRLLTAFAPWLRVDGAAPGLVAARRLLSAGIGAVCALLMACSAHESSGGNRPQAAGRATLYVANYVGYIGTHTIADFERATGLKVVYGTYDSANTLEAWIWAGDLRYDVVSTSSDFFSREIKAGGFQPLDRSKILGWSNLDPAVLAALARADPGNRYAVPYLHSLNGFAYNVDMIRARMPDAPVDSLDMIFNPAIVRRFADCGVTLLDSPSDVLPLALNYLHLDPNSGNPKDYRAAERLLLAIRPYVRAFDSTEYLSNLANGESCIAMAWSSDAAFTRGTLRAIGSRTHIAFTVPKEGACISYDALLIPVGAPDPQDAYRFINFLLEPKVIAAITNEIWYGNNNRTANQYVNPDILDDPTIYPDPATRLRLYQQSESNPATERIRTRTWTRVKTGK
ncbi:MAG: extracellular solute-binding protein [Steroidobacteraceae bacterium]